MSEPGVQLLDADGNGRADLMVIVQRLLPADIRWRVERARIRALRNAPTVNLDALDVRLMDLDGDGVTDALPAGPQFELYYNDPDHCWSDLELRERIDSDSVPNVTFEDPRVKRGISTAIKKDNSMPIIGVPLNPGNTGPHVRELHLQLMALGAVIESCEQNATTYGPSTAAAVRAFRQRYGLPAGDAVDLATGRLLHVASAGLTGTNGTLRQALRESFAAAQNPSEAEITWLAEYAVIARDFTTARKAAALAPSSAEIREKVRDAATTRPESKKDWELTEGAFRQLLDWLDEGVDSGGEKYLEMRRRLVSFFDRKNCLAPEHLADETLNRVARRLKEEGAITNTTSAHYCYIVARFVFLEYLRRTETDAVSLDSLLQPGAPTLKSAPNCELQDLQQEREKHLDCLERCLQRLEPENRELILHYYYGEQRAKIENRRALAERFGLTINALSIRACRVRSRLEACVSECSE